MSGRSFMRAMLASAACLALLIPAAAQAGAAPSLAFTPSTAGAYDYGTIAAGQTATQTFTLANLGGKASAALTIALSGSAAFTITSDGCTATGLGPRKSCTVTVEYAPTAAGQSDSATLAATGKKAAASTSIDLTGASAAGTSPVPRRVIIDTDMAADDWLAILYLLNRPEVTVAAITVTGTGEAHCEPGVRHARALVALAGKPDIPVACGRETPLEGTHTFPDAWRERVDSLLGIQLPDGPDQPDPGSALDLLATTLGAGTDNTMVLTLGPLTNLGELLRSSPELGARIDQLYIMGGAVEVEGNVGVSGVGIDNPYAEWNIYVDPEAARIVLESGVPVTLIGLDATNQAPVTHEFIDRMSADSETPEANFVAEVLEIQRELVEFGYYFWDPFAAAVLVDETLTSFESAALTVVTQEGRESGRVVPTDDGVPARYAVSADRQRLEDLMIDTLNGRAK